MPTNLESTIETLPAYHRDVSDEDSQTKRFVDYVLSFKNQIANDGLPVYRPSILRVNKRAGKAKVAVATGFTATEILNVCDPKRFSIKERKIRGLTEDEAIYQFLASLRAHAQVLGDLEKAKLIVIQNKNMLEVALAETVVELPAEVVKTIFEQSVPLQIRSISTLAAFKRHVSNNDLMPVQRIEEEKVKITQVLGEILAV